MPEDLLYFERLRDRDLRKEGIFIGEGNLVVERMLSSSLEVLGVVCTERHAERYRDLAADRCPVHSMSEPELGRLVGFPFHRGVIAAGKRPVSVSLSGSRFSGTSILAVCPHIGENENLGSIIRSCAAFGADGLVLGIRAADPFSRKAVRASMGTVFGIRLYETSRPAAGGEYGEARETAGILRENGCIVAGAVSCGAADTPESFLASISHDSRIRGIALVFGNEAEGIDDAWKLHCDRFVRIPMANGIDSLNVGVAAGILLYALSAFHSS